MSPYRSWNPYPPAAHAPRPAHGLTPPPAFQLADLIRLIDARRALILRVALGVFLCALAAALMLPTVWSGSVTVMLDQRKNNITDLTAVVSQLPGDPASVQNQLQIIQSRALAATVVDRLHLDRDPEFNPALGAHGLTRLLNPRNWFGNHAAPAPAIVRDRVIDNFLKHVDAQAQGLSTSITITATSRDAAKAARMANTLADAYVKGQVASKVSVTQATTGWLNQRLSDLAQQLQTQQEAIQRYKAEHDLNDTAPGSSLVDQQMSALSGQIVQARSDLAEKQAIKNRIDQLMAGGNPADVSQIASSPLIVQLRTQQTDILRQEADLTSKYGPLHPKIQAIQQQKRDLDTKIAQEVNRLAGSAASDVLVARAHLDSLLGSLGGTESTARTQNMARVQLEAMESNAASTRSQYEAFVQRLRSAQNMDEVQAPDAHVISPAAMPLVPSGPKRTLIVGASIPLGLLLGLLAALVAEKIGPLLPVKVNGAPRAALVPPAMRRAAPHRMPDAPAGAMALWNGPPILAEIDDPAQSRAADFVLDYPASKYAHAMARLVRQLESPAGHGAAIVALTSPDNGENRSAIAVSLTRAAARMGKKSIIVDCAPGHLASRILKARIRSGLHDVLTGAVPLNKALARDPRGEAHLLCAAGRAPDRAAMYASRPMAQLMAVLRGGADFVVMDCGPANGAPDAALLARLADATVLVTRRPQLNSPLAANALTILESARTAPIGIVVTG